MAEAAEKVACPDCGKQVRERGMAAHKRFCPGAPAEAAPSSDDVGGGLFGEPETAEQRPRSSAEPATSQAAAGARGLLEKLRPKAKGTTKPTAERKPRVSFRRHSTSGLFEFVWSQGGQALMVSGRDVPVGRVMALQAPMVGDVLDDAVKGTVLDKVLQPFVRQGDRAKLVGAVVLPPLLVGALERNPELAPTLMPILRASMIPMLVEMAKAAKKAKAEEQKLFEALDEVADSLPPELLAEAKERGMHPVDALIASIFAPPPEPHPANNSEAPAPAGV